MRLLLSTKNEFIRTLNLNAVLSAAKQTLSSAPIFSYFGLNKPTCLCTDANCQELGFVLQQKNGDAWTLPILNTHRLDEIENPCLQRLWNRIMAYNFTAQWIKDTLSNAPDALSKNPVSDPQPQELMAEYSLQNNPGLSA